MENEIVRFWPATKYVTDNDVWGMFHYDELEQIHRMTKKNVLHLPINTTGYIVRLRQFTRA